MAAVPPVAYIYSPEYTARCDALCKAPRRVSAGTGGLGLPTGLVLTLSLLLFCLFFCFLTRLPPGFAGQHGALADRGVLAAGAHDVSVAVPWP